MLLRVLQRVIVAAVCLSASYALSADEVQSGAGLYIEHCAACHGPQLEGQPNWQTPNTDGTLPAPPHDETGHTWHHGDQLLFDYAKFGGTAAMSMREAPGFKSAMSGFEAILSDDEIWEVLAFIKSHWSGRARTYQEQVTANEP